MEYLVAKAREVSVIRLKVALKFRKSIWRRIEIRSDQTLHDLHSAIFNAFDRYDEHLYSFYFPNPKAPPRSGRRGMIEYTNSEMAFGYDDDAETRSTARTALGSLRLSAKKTFEYLFDFGDCWEHLITVESTGGVVGDDRYPTVVASKGKSPPQYPDDEEDEDEDDGDA